MLTALVVTLTIAVTAVGGHSSQAATVRHQHYALPSSCTPDVTPGELTETSDGTLWIPCTRTSIVSRSPAGAYREYPTGAADVKGDMAVGPDDVIWFVTSRGIASMTRDGLITSYRANVLAGWQITVRPDNSAWFVDTRRRIAKLNTDGRVTVFPVPRAARPQGLITTGPDGAVWFLSERRFVGRITPSGQVRTFPLPEVASGGGSALVPGPGRALWLSGYVGIVRISTSGRMRLFRYPRNDGAMGPIVEGPDHALWFGYQPSTSFTRQIARMTPNGRFTYHRIGRQRVVDLVSGPGSNIWYVTSSYDGGLPLGRITVP